MRAASTRFRTTATPGGAADPSRAIQTTGMPERRAPATSFSRSIADEDAVGQVGADSSGGGGKSARVGLLGAHGGRKDDRIQEAGQSQLVEHERQEVAVVAEDANAHPRRSNHANGRPGIWKHAGRKGLGQFGGHVINVEMHGGRIAKLIHVDTGVGEL